MKALCQFLIIIALLLMCLDLVGQESQKGGPYFLLENEENIGNFPLQSNDIQAQIQGPIAYVTLKQTYKNQGEVPMEAIYVFPASTRAAVHGMQMKIGDRTIVAKIKEKLEARATYEKAKKEGKRSSLLEQHLPNVFQMNVANILPGETVEIILEYTEFIIPKNQVYEWVYPMVVGPRYNGEKQVDWAKQAYQKKGSPAQYKNHLTVALETAVPIHQITSTSHQLNIKNNSGTRASVEFHTNEKNPGNRDFILQYQLSGNQISTGIQVYKHKDKHFFLCQMEPPKMTSQPIIVPREYIFLLDVSGSMKGRPLDISKELMSNLLDGIHPDDKFNVLFFSGGSNILFPSSRPATKANLELAMCMFNNNTGGGGTHILNALQQSMSIPKEESYARSFIIVTDGFVSVDKEVFKLIHEKLNEANFFAFGIGRSVNRNLIEGIAHVGRSEAYVITDMAKAKQQADAFKVYIESPMLTDIKIEGKGVELYDLIPENTPDLFGERPIYFFGKFKNNEKGRLEISGNQACNQFHVSLSIPSASETSNNPALPYLWAREKIRFIDDFNGLAYEQKRADEVRDLGLQYNLLTAYTSFVAVDDVVVNRGGENKQVKQALPMPSGVENSAIGMEMVIEPMLIDGVLVNKIDIDIKGLSQSNRQILEVILENYIQQLTTLERQEIMLGGATLSASKGQWKILPIDAKHSQDLLIYIQEKLRALNIQSETWNCVIILKMLGL